MVIQPLLQTIGVSERLVKRKSPASNSPKVAECNGARREWAAPRRRQRRATRQGAAPYRLGCAMTLAICHHGFSGGHMHAHCTQPPENSGKGRGNQGEGSTRMGFLRLTNMPNAMIMDLRKRFFRMTDAFFFFFIGCSIDGTSRQPTLRNNRRNVWLRMRFSSLNYMHSNGWFRFRAKGVNGFSQRH